MPSIGYLNKTCYFLARRAAFLVVVLALAMALGCGHSSGGSVDAVCAGFGAVADRSGLIGQG